MFDGVIVWYSINAKPFSDLTNASSKNEEIVKMNNDLYFIVYFIAKFYFFKLLIFNHLISIQFLFYILHILGCFKSVLKTYIIIFKEFFFFLLRELQASITDLRLLFRHTWSHDINFKIRNLSLLYITNGNS